MQLISLSDLENDFINPHDASSQINAWVVRTVMLMHAQVAAHCCLDALLSHGLRTLRIRAQMPEYGIQAALVLTMLLSRRWVVLLIHLPVLAYHVRTFALDAYKTDVTEIFRQLPRERRIRIIKLAIYMGGFVFIVYKCAFKLGAMPLQQGWLPRMGRKPAGADCAHRLIALLWHALTTFQHLHASCLAQRVPGATCDKSCTQK